MADGEKPAIGHNLSELKKKIQTAISSVRAYKSEREETNAAIAEVRSSLKAAGIPKAAFDMALRYLDWEPEKREGFDLAYAIVREAGGLPLAEDLFAAAERIEKEAGDKAKETAKKTEADAVKNRERKAAEEVFKGMGSVN